MPAIVLGLMLLLGCVHQAAAQSDDTCVHAWLVADRAAPRASMRKVEALLLAEGGKRLSQSPGSFSQMEFPGGSYVYLVLEHAEAGESQQLISVFCHVPGGGARVICDTIKKRFYAK